MILSYKFLIILLNYLILKSTSQCPNRCNQNGVCNTTNIYLCECFPTYNASADCSRRSCPYEKAWSGKSIYNNSYPGNPHGYAECSNRGKCNRDTGNCECFPGYEGHACQRSSCNCQNGKCLTIGQIYSTTNVSLTPFSYIGWESNHTTACVCDWGYTGPACEFRMCPKGFDPLQSYDYYRTINITTSLTYGYFSGYFTFIFDTFSFEFPANGNYWTSTDCQTSFQSLPNIESVVCTQGPISLYGETQYEIQIKQFSVVPYENNIYVNDGNPSLSRFSCLSTSVTGASNPSCVLTDIVASNVPEYKYCSNRGVCNPSSGECSCFTSFSSSSCSSYTFGINAITDNRNEDVLSLQNVDDIFYGNILHLITNYSASSSYNALKLSNDNNTVFVMNGVGDINMYNGSLYVYGNYDDYDGGMTISHKGLELTGGMTVQGGLNVNSKGLTINSGNLNIVNGRVEVDEEIISYSGAAITGGLSIHNDGLKVFAGGLAISVNGMSILSDGIVINGVGINVWKSSVILTGGLTINSKGMNINNAGLTVTTNGITSNKGLTVNSNNLYINGQLKHITGTMIISNGITIQNAGLIISNGLTINNYGLVLTGGFTVLSKGLFIQSNGLTIYSGGAITSGNLYTLGTASFMDIGLFSKNGITVNNGISSNTEVIVYDSGMAVTNGITVFTGGVVISNGLSIKSSGLYITTGGLSVYNIGLYMSGGLTVSNAYLYTSMTIQNSGIMATGSLTLYNIIVQVNSGGFKSGGGVYVSQQGALLYDKGAIITGGITIGGSAILAGLAVSGGMSLRSSGLVLSGGLTATSSTLSLDSLTVYDGLYVGGGITVPSLNAYAVSLADLTIYSKPYDAFTVSGTLHTNVMTIYGNLISTGGFTVNKGMGVSGGLTIGGTLIAVDDKNDLGVTVMNGVYLYGGLTINGGISIFGGSTIYTGGLYVSGGMSLQGMQVTGGGHLSFGLLSVSNGMNIQSGGMICTDPIYFEVNDGLALSGGMTINDMGFVITTGLTINSNGLYSNSQLSIGNGLYVTGTMSVDSISPLPSSLAVNNGLIVKGDVTVHSSGVSTGLVITNGATINQILNVLGGLTVYSSSINILSGGLTIFNGLTVNGGLSIVTGTFSNSGGLTIETNGLVVSDGLLSLSNSGIEITGGLSIQNKGFNVKNGMTIFDSGLWISNGLTVQGNVVLSSAPNIFSDKNLKININNITNSLNNIIKLRGVYYNWKTDSSDEIDTLGRSNRRIGLIAQEVQEIFPNIVKLIKKKMYLGITYQQLIPILIEAITELYDKIKIMKNLLITSKDRLIHIDNNLFYYNNIYNDITSNII